MSSPGVVNFFIRGLALTGIGICVYAFIAHSALQKDPKYKPFCDIDQQLNCSKVFSSSYVKGFGLAEKYLGKSSPFNQPNYVYGGATYTLIILLSFLNYVLVSRFSLLISLISLAFSAYVHYVYYFTLGKVVCPIAVAIAVVNLLLAVLTLVKVNKLKNGAGKNKNKNKKKKQK